MVDNLTKSPKVVVVGGSYIDISVKCDGFPTAHEHVNGTSLSYTVGGPGPTQAVQAALCGCEVHLISKIGGDCFASQLRGVFANYKVNNDFVFVAQPMKTGAFITMVSPIGENASIVYSGANSALHIQEVQMAEQVISEADVCLIHGQLPQEAITEAINLSKLHGTKVILNPARPLDKGAKDEELPIEYFSADVMITNLYEAADIVDQATASLRSAKLIGSDLVARGVKAAVITMGKRGCVVVDRDGADHIPAFEIELVNHGGSGDAFAAALAGCCASGDEIRRAVTFASAAGALTCTKLGTIEALPTKADIIQLLQAKDA